MRKLNLLMASSAVGLVAMAGSVSIAPADTLTGSALDALTYSACSSCSAAYSSSAAGGAGGAVLTSDNQVGGGGIAQFQDTATVAVPTSLGTLNTALTSGAAGNVTFDLFSATATAGDYAYWNVELTNPVNGVTATLNSYGDNNLGANPFNTGSSVSTSGGYDSNGNHISGFTAWSTLAGESEQSQGICSTAGCSELFGDWTVTAMTISVGGWDNSGTTAQTDVVDSITVPNVVTTPLPASVWLFAGGLGFMGLLGWRKKRKGEASVWPTQVAEGAALAA